MLAETGLGMLDSSLVHWQEMAWIKFSLWAIPWKQMELVQQTL